MSKSVTMHAYYTGAVGRIAYIDVLSQELVRYAVFVDDIVVHASSGSGRAREEAEKPETC